jgi:hypothetical protein
MSTIGTRTERAPRGGICCRWRSRWLRRANRTGTTACLASVSTSFDSTWLFAATGCLGAANSTIRTWSLGRGSRHRRLHRAAADPIPSLASRLVMREILAPHMTEIRRWCRWRYRLLVWSGFPGGLSPLDEHNLNSDHQTPSGSFAAKIHQHRPTAVGRARPVAWCFSSRSSLTPAGRNRVTVDRSAAATRPCAP